MKFDLPVQGEPIPEITWTKEGTETPIASSKSQQITLSNTETGTKLSLNNITRAQAGVYTVTAVNESGEDSASVTINVMGVSAAPEGVQVMIKILSIDGNHVSTTCFKHPT